MSKKFYLKTKHIPPKKTRVVLVETTRKIPKFRE